MKSSRERFLPQNKRDKEKKFFLRLELLSLNNSNKKKLLKRLKLKRWNRNSSLLRLFKRPKLLQQRKQLLRPILLD
jgi:hypothetical protein